MRGILEATSLRGDSKSARRDWAKHQDAMAHLDNDTWLNEALEMESFREWQSNGQHKDEEYH